MKRRSESSSSNKPKKAKKTEALTNNRFSG